MTVLLGVEKLPVTCAENTKDRKKSQALGMTKGRGEPPSNAVAGQNVMKKTPFFRPPPSKCFRRRIGVSVVHRGSGKVEAYA